MFLIDLALFRVCDLVRLCLRAKQHSKCLRHVRKSSSTWSGVGHAQTVSLGRWPCSCVLQLLCLLTCALSCTLFLPVLPDCPPAPSCPVLVPKVKVPGGAGLIPLVLHLVVLLTTPLLGLFPEMFMGSAPNRGTVVLRWGSKC